jgi:hypothetical protein
MACWGVLVDVDLSTWTGGGFPFRPSKTLSAGWFPVARSFSALPVGVFVTVGEGFAFSAAAAPPTPKRKKDTIANTTMAILPIHPPLC